MSKFINEKINTISVWTNPTQDIKDNFICKEKLMVYHFITEFEKTINGNKQSKRFEISRIICGTKILDESWNLNST